MSRKNAASCIVTAALALSVAAFTAAGHAAAGNGRGHYQDPPCTITPSPVAVGQSYVVSASGLPIGTAINLWITDPNGNTTGRPLGSTPDGSFNLSENSSSTGTWRYAFTGPTKQNTTVYSTCSVVAY